MSFHRMPLPVLALIIVVVLLSITIHDSHAFVPRTSTSTISPVLRMRQILRLRLTKLPSDISPFEKSNSKRRDVQADFRALALKGLDQALKDGQNKSLEQSQSQSQRQPLKLLELEFPPLLGGDLSKSQFDDFDNVQELNKNRDWCIELLPSLTSKLTTLSAPIWFILPDLKEVELCKAEWGGQRYRQAGTFTSIEAVTDHYASGSSSSNTDDSVSSSSSYNKPWGATFASAASAFLEGDKGGSGLLGDRSCLDSLDGDSDSNGNGNGDGKAATLHLVCQPGNGGPVEDWCNVKAFHEASGGSIPTCIVNGALDKVRDGYYPGFVFPKLAKTFDFYKQFEAVLFLKPISDKGLYGWVFRVYPEPWQVVLQTPTKNKKDELVIEDTVVLVQETRPSYAECVQALLSGTKDKIM